MKKSILLLILFLLNPAFSKCMIYFTGIGCPHCARADPVVFNLFDKYPNLTIIEYEVYQNKENAPLLTNYCNSLNLSFCGIPFAIKGNYLMGDSPIINNIDNLIKDSSNECDINLSNLNGNPKIWIKNGIIYKDNGWVLEWNDNLNINEIIKRFNLNNDYEKINPKPIPISGNFINFKNAIKFKKLTNNSNIITKLTLPKVVSLAIVDAVNPCALAVLTLILLSITTYNKHNKKKVLLAGLSFSFAVFVMYFFYGLILIKFFQLIQALTSIKLFLYKVLGAIAIILGVLELKDFFHYSPGGILTEMPLRLRPIAGKIIKEITSSKGAFFIGLFVTIFLLPCTIGPYVITSGLLSAIDLIKAFPYLFLYNLIFISPMIGITLIVYGGISKTQDVKRWRKRNVRLLHLIAGIIILMLGIGMVLGIF